jgi:hypothetical protein
VAGVGWGVVGGTRVRHLVSHGHGGADVVKMRQPVRDCGFHSMNHGVEGGDCCARGRVNEGLRESHTRVPRRRHATTTSMGVRPWVGRRMTAKRATPESHTRVL